MIIKSSTRGSRGLGEHIKAAENERVQVTRADGIVSIDPEDAVAELTAQGAASATASPLVHASISPDREMTPEQWDRAWATWEQARGLEAQPFLEVEHQKEGRVHRHRVYSRVDPERGAALRQSHEYVTNERVARQLELRFGHELTPGAHSRAVQAWAERHDPELAQAMEAAAAGPRPEAAMSHGQWQQQARTGVDARDLASTVVDAWQRSDSPAAFSAALEEQGLALAEGRKTPQVVDAMGEAHDLRRTLRAGGERVKAAQVRAKVPDGPESVEQVRDRQRAAARTAAAARDHSVDTEGPATEGQSHGHATAPAQEAAATTGDTTTADQARPGRPSEGDPVAAARAHVHDLEQRAARAVPTNNPRATAMREIAGPQFRAHEQALSQAKREQREKQEQYERALRKHEQYQGIGGFVRSIRHPFKQRQAALEVERKAQEAESADEALAFEKAQNKKWKEWVKEPENKERVDARAAEIKDGIQAENELPKARRELKKLEREHSPGHEPQHEHEKGPRMKM